MASDTLPGRNMWIGVGIQTTMTTIAQVYNYYQPTDVGGFLEEFATIDSGRRLGTRFSGLPYLGTKQVPFSFTVECTPDIGRILALGMGDYSLASVTSVCWDHYFKCNEELGYGTILCHAAGTADATSTAKEIRIIGAKINRMTIAGGIDNVLTLAVEGIGMTMSATTAAMTATYTSYNPLFLNSGQGTGTLSIGSTITAPVLFEEARSFELTITNGIKPDHRIHGSATPVAISEGSSDVTGTISAVYNDNTFVEINKFAAGNKRAITLTASGDAVPSLPTTATNIVIGLHSVRYTGDPPRWDPDVMSVDMPFKAEITASTYIAIRNDHSTVYSAAT